MPKLDIAGGSFEGFSPEMQAAISAAAIPSLGDGPRDENLCGILSSRKQDDFLTSVADARRKECLSGLWLLAGDIDRSHTISQDIPSANGSFLHGIMHRREGDFGNSKYWFRRVGSHPVLDQIAELAGDVYDDPFDFVDTCQRVADGASELKDACLQAQWIEWQLLMQHILEG